MDTRYPVEDLLSFLHNVEPLSDNFRNLLPTCMEPLEGPLTENTILLKPGEMANIASWMPIGYARAYIESPPKDSWKKSPDQQTIGFWKGPGLILVKDSFFKRTPATHFLEIAKSSVLHSIAYDSLQLMKQQTPEANELIGKILSEDYAAVFDRATLLKLPARERYAVFLEHFGVMIEEYFEIQDIASYLGMTPTTLSIIRR